MSHSPQTLLLPANPLANYLAHKEETDSAVSRVLEGGLYILGKEVAEFEREFAAYIGVSDVISVGSGTDALQLALKACNVNPGDIVVTVSHTAVATVASIELAGGSPLLIDIDPQTFTMDVEELEAVVACHSNRVKAIIPVHLYGHPADMPRIMEVAQRHNTFVIEDCSQSHGATLLGRRTGNWGHIGAFSFYPTKNLGALGDGGAVVTNDRRLAERARLLRQYGWRTRYVSEIAGMNSRLDEIQAAILRVKLRHLDAENRKRQQIAAAYDAAFSSTGLCLPQANVAAQHVYHQYTVRSERRDELQASLKQEGIGTSILYPQPVHLQPAYARRLVHGMSGFRHTERISREILSLPMHPHLTEQEVTRVIEAVHRATA